MSNSVNWGEWTALPTTSTAGDIDDFNNLQFAYPTREMDFTAWTDLSIETHYNHLSRTISYFGYHRGDQFELTDRAVYRSGPKLDWDYIIDNIPESDNFTDAVTLYTVVFPDSHPQDKPDQLVAKAIRSKVYSGRQIGSLYKYGNYVTVSLAIYRRRFSGSNITDTRLSDTIVSCQVLEDNAVDVGETETRLEYFYIDYNMMFVLAKQMGIDVTTPEGEAEFEALNIKLGDFFIGISSTAYVSDEATYFTSYRFWAPEKDYFSTQISGLPNCERANPAYGIGADKDGYGDANPTHDFHSDHITRTANPTMSALTGGFVNAYKVTPALLSNLGKCLFPDWDWLNTVEVDHWNVVNAIWEGLKYLIDVNYNKGSIEYIIDCHILPINVPASTYTSITCGGKELVNPATDRVYGAYSVDGLYATKSCGSLTIPEAFGNFLDYTVRCKLYLPCYGYIDIPPEYWNGGTLSVEYVFNVFDGTFVAFVTGKAKHSQLNSLIGQYSGSACTHIPLSGRDYSQVISGLASIVGGTVAGTAGIVAGGAGAVFSAASYAGLASKGASNIGSVLSAKQPMVSSGSSNSSSAMLMHKKPYLIIEYPSPQFSTRYPQEKGLPLNVQASLGTYGGMTIADNPILDGIPCTENEKIRIKEALLSGLIFR